MTNSTSTPGVVDDLPPAARETVDLVATHRRLVVRATLGACALALALAVAAPGFLPPNVLTGLLSALFALAVGVGAAVIADSRDPVLRSGRHVAASGGAVVTDADDVPGAAAALHDLIDPGLDEGGPWRFGVTGPDADRAAALAEALATRLAAGGRRVVVADLTAPPADGPSVDAVLDGVDWRETVDLETATCLARLRPGDPGRTPAAVAWLAPRLPLDVEALVVALPGLPDGCRELAAQLDDVLLVSTPGHDAREDLRDQLTTLADWSVPGEVVLVRPEPAVEEPPATSPAPPPPAPVVGDETREEGLVRIIESPGVPAGVAHDRSPAMAGVRRADNGRRASDGRAPAPSPSPSDDEALGRAHADTAQWPSVPASSDDLRGRDR